MIIQDKVEELVHKFPICRDDAEKIIKNIKDDHKKQCIILSKDLSDICIKYLALPDTSTADIVAALELIKFLILGEKL